MKELSIEQKAKAYDEAKARMNKAYNDNRCTISFMNEIFPELKIEESEDERIRKELLNAFQDSEDSLYMVLTPHRRESFIAWLEKQGKTSPILSNSLNIGKVERKPADKVEPKFKAGDTIRLKNGDGLEWTVREVLSNGYYTIVCADRDDFIQLDDNWELVEHKPTFEMKTPEESLGIDSDTYNKIVDECVYGEQTSADETPYPETLEKAINLYYYSYGNGKGEFEHLSLEKFRDIVHTFVSDYGQKTAWSEEDERTYKSVLYAFEHNYPLNSEQQKFVKSLKDRYTWKPSDEQMKAIKWIIDGDNPENWRITFENLYQDLKKLREK